MGATVQNAADIMLTMIYGERNDIRPIRPLMYLLEQEPEGE